MEYVEILKDFFNIGFKQSSFEKRCGFVSGKTSEVLRGRTLINEKLIDETIMGIRDIQQELDVIIDRLIDSKENSENNYLVYELSFPDGKKYYGRTYNTDARWQRGYGYKTQKVGKAIEEVGWENVQKRIIAENLTKENAQIIEHSLIKGTQSDVDLLGYNEY